jgi:hypothetical protein
MGVAGDPARRQYGPAPHQSPQRDCRPGLGEREHGATPRQSAGRSGRLETRNAQRREAPARDPVNNEPPTSSTAPATRGSTVLWRSCLTGRSISSESGGIVPMISYRTSVGFDGQDADGATPTNDRDTAASRTRRSTDIETPSRDGDGDAVRVDGTRRQPNRYGCSARQERVAMTVSFGPTRTAWWGQMKPS